MSLVDRYVESVRGHLPRAQRNDIAAELRDTLLSHIEEAEAKQGRRLTDDEIAEVLKGYGAPDVVAARYGARDHLIGPAIYAHYRAVIRLVLWTLGGLIALGLIVTALTADDPLMAMLRVLWTGILVTLANLTIVTLLFARAERIKKGSATAEPWDPRELLEREELRTAIPRGEALASLLLTIFWLLWWTDVLPINRWLIWDRVPLSPAPIWDALTPLIVTLMAVNIALSIVALLRPRLVRFYEAAELLIDIGIGVVLFRALRAPQLIALTDAASPAASFANLLNTLLVVALLAWGLLVIASVGATLQRWIVLARKRRLVAT